MRLKTWAFVYALGPLALTALVIATSPAAYERGAGADLHASQPKVAISFGDSFSSGEGGRWKGNSVHIDTANKAGTDLAAEWHISNAYEPAS
jgi:hypothetical protein